MISNELIEQTKKTLEEMDGFTVIEHATENDDRDFVVKFSVDNTTFLMKLQDETDNLISESKELTFILSINYMLRIKKLPKTKKEIDLLKAANRFNEKYAISKCIFVKREKEGDVFWFRTESLLDSMVSGNIIKSTIGSLKSSPKLLTEIIRDQ